jgi:hypothetical protein
MSEKSKQTYRTPFPKPRQTDRKQDCIDGGQRFIVGQAVVEMAE